MSAAHASRMRESEWADCGGTASQLRQKQISNLLPFMIMIHASIWTENGFPSDRTRLEPYTLCSTHTAYGTSFHSVSSLPLSSLFFPCSILFISFLLDIRIWFLASSRRESSYHKNRCWSEFYRFSWAGYSRLNLALSHLLSHSHSSFAQ